MELIEDKVFWYGILTIPLVTLCIVVFYVNIIHPFLVNKRYIKSEILRSCDEEEFSFWKNELKKLYISQIPFLGKLIINHTKSSK